MPIDDYGCPERKIEVELGVSSKQLKPADKARLKPLLPQIENFVGKPKLTKEERKKWDVDLEWAGFVGNRKILKSKNRTKLKEHLDKLLAGLNLRYLDNCAKSFPSSGELTKLTETMTALARLLGIKKQGFSGVLSAMKRVENRWSKMQLISFADALYNRLLKVTACPLSVLHQAGINNKARRETFQEIAKFLNGSMSADEAIPWGKWYDEIKTLNFPTSALFQMAGTSELKKGFSAVVSSHKNAVAYLVFMDLRRQQLEWDCHYGKPTQASLKWIYSLQRPEDYRKTMQVYCGSAPSPEQMKKSEAVLGNRERRKRSYRKHRPRTK